MKPHLSIMELWKGENGWQSVRGVEEEEEEEGGGGGSSLFVVFGSPNLCVGVRKGPLFFLKTWLYLCDTRG